MSDNVYSADVNVEDSVREYNGAGFVVFLGVAGLVAFGSGTLALVIFRDRLPAYNLLLSLFFTVIGIIYCIYIIVHHSLEKNATYNYTYNNGIFEIAKVRKNGQRKLKFSAECEWLEFMGTSRALVKNGKWDSKKIQDYTKMEFYGEGLDGNRRETYEAFFNIEGKNVRVQFSPSEEFVKAINSQYPAKVIFENKG